MKKHRHHTTAGLGALGLLALLTGCSGGHYIVATTSTVIGIEVAQNPQTQIPIGRVGYARNEFALVPTNRPTTKKEPALPTNAVIGGADQATDVLMEVKASNLLSFDSTIYQRMAVGKNAVMQPGAALMFARDNDGNIDATAAAAIQNIQAKLPAESAGDFHLVQAVRDLLTAMAKPENPLAQKLHDDLEQVSGLDPASVPFVLTRGATATDFIEESVKLDPQKTQLARSLDSLSALETEPASWTRP